MEIPKQSYRGEFSQNKNPKIILAEAYMVPAVILVCLMDNSIRKGSIPLGGL